MPVLKNKYTGKIVVFGPGIVDFNVIGCKNYGETIEAGWFDYTHEYNKKKKELSNESVERDNDEV